MHQPHHLLLHEPEVPAELREGLYVLPAREADRLRANPGKRTSLRVVTVVETRSFAGLTVMTQHRRLRDQLQSFGQKKNAKS